jgi:hypothetical protein
MLFRDRSVFARLFSRRATLASVPIAVLSARGALAQESTPAPDDDRRIGVNTRGATAFEFVGKIEQRGLEFSLLSYVTHIARVSSGSLFSGDDPFARAEADARVTIVATASGTARSILENLFVVNGSGGAQFFLIDGGASFDDPASFSTGTEIANASIRMQDVINVQAPQQGIATGVGDLTLEVTSPFDLDGESYVLGEPGVRYRLSFSGQGTLRDPETLESTVLIAGYGTYLG